MNLVMARRMQKVVHSLDQLANRASSLRARVQLDDSFSIFPFAGSLLEDCGGQTFFVS